MSLPGFSILPIFNVDDLPRCFALRHQIYCEELGFEPCNEAKQETDRYDAFSEHFLLTHDRSGQSAGTVRNVVPCQDHHTLPVERFITIPHDRATVCEISRIAVPGWLRGKSSPVEVVQLNDDERRSAHMLSLVLALCSLYSINANQRDHVYVVMEPRLARQLAKFGLVFTACGDAIVLNGERYPYYASTVELNRGLNPELRPLYHSIEAAYLNARSLQHAKTA